MSSGSFSQNLYKKQFRQDAIPVFPKIRRYSFDLKSVELTKNFIQTYDCIVVATNHDDFDYSLILENSKLIIDSMVVYSGHYENVIHA